IVVVFGPRRVEAAELDEPRLGIRSRDARDLAQPHAVPRRNRAPALHAVVPDADVGPGHLAQVVHRQGKRPRAEPFHLELPPSGRRRYVVRDVIDGKRLEVRERALIAGELSLAKEQPLRPVVPALHRPEKAFVRSLRVASRRPEKRRAQERPAAEAAHRRFPPVKIEASSRGCSATSTMWPTVNSASATRPRRRTALAPS